MHPTSRSSSDETRPLLEEVPPSYSAPRHNDSAASEQPHDEPAMVKFSKADTVWILSGLWSGVLLGAFDGTVVATLLTPIGSQFKASNQASYIGTSYLLSVCCFTPLYGRMADILGRKGAMLVALSLFGSGTICCGFAPSMQALIAARAVAGMGGGGKKRGLYQGMANILYGLGAGLGGPLGGWVNDVFGWRAAFYMQTPFLLFSFIVVATKVNIPLPLAVRQQSLSDKLRRIDVLGSLTLSSTVGCLLLSFSIKTAEELPWSHPLIYGLLIASITFGIMFMRKTGKLYGLTLVSSGMTILASILLVLWNESSSAWHLYFDLVPQGFGMASFITSTLIAMIAGVYKEDMAVATGITYLFRTTGQVVGVSLSGAVLQAVLLQKLRLRIRGPGSSELIEAIRKTTEIIPELEANVQRAAVESYADALRVALLLASPYRRMYYRELYTSLNEPHTDPNDRATHEEQEQHYRNQNTTSSRGT
ncbi:hypothetical protein H0H93_008338 [Arthromyces matolae]|nr:hypothetical protein H0H93_008338 [Arthromyces matolae]